MKKYVAQAPDPLTYPELVLGFSGTSTPLLCVSGTQQCLGIARLPRTGDADCGSAPVQSCRSVELWGSSALPEMGMWMGCPQACRKIWPEEGTSLLAGSQSCERAVASGGLSGGVVLGDVDLKGLLLDVLTPEVRELREFLVTASLDVML